MSDRLNPSRSAWRDVIGNAMHGRLCDEHRQWQSCPAFRERVNSADLRIAADAVHDLARVLEREARSADE